VSARDQLALGCHGADDDVAALLADALQVRDAGEVDEVLGRREPELHHRDQAMASGQRPRVLAEIGQHGHRFIDGFRAVIGEGAWDHGQSLPGQAGRGRCPSAAAFSLDQ
jgi:hypothetical protein